MNPIQQAIEGLERIVRWDGLSSEFKMDYGSNGERDHFRGVASDALSALQSLQGVELPEPFYTEKSSFGWPDLWDEAGVRTAVAAAMARGAVPQGYALVPDAALRWLFGEEGDFVCPPDRYFRGAAPPYWWRSVLRDWIAAAPTPVATQPTQAQAPSEWEVLLTDDEINRIAYLENYCDTTIATRKFARAIERAALATQQAETPDENNQWIAEAKKTLDHLARFLYRTGAPHEVNWRDWIDSAEKHLATQQAGHGEAVGDERWWSPPDSFGTNWLTNGAALHPLTANLVVRFARALAAKLAAAEVKYGYSDGWRSADWMDECRAKLAEHVAKGDPRDVAAYCAFLWHHGESTATPHAPQQPEALAQQERDREDAPCPDGLLPDGEICPRCGGKRGPSGIDGGSWVHIRAARSSEGGSNG